MKKGFTLSEVLITLGIVGIIAALTIPTILKNYRNKVYASQLKRVYSQISEAAQAIRNDEQTDNFYTTSAGVPQDSKANDCKTGPCYFLNHYFNLANQDCETGDHKCLGDTYKTLQGNAMDTPFGSYCAQTVNGTTICMIHNSDLAVSSIIVDVNGPSEPNMGGRDVFSMDIKTDGSLSDYGSGSNIPGSAGFAADKCGTAGASNNAYDKSGGCLTKILEAGWQMDY